MAAERGLILVDTKYEFGKDADGKIIIVDEIHTPDSSRYWVADTYEEVIIYVYFIILYQKEYCPPLHDTYKNSPTHSIFFSTFAP